MERQGKMGYNPKDKKIAEFIAKIEAYKEFFGEIEITVVAVRNGSRDGWINLATKAQFHILAAPIDQAIGLRFSEGDLIVIRDLIPFMELDRLLKNLEEGVLKVCDYLISFGEYEWSIHEGAITQYNTKWNALKLEGIGRKSIHTLLPSDMTEELRYQGRYESINELLQNIIEYNGSMCYIEIVAPIYIKINCWIEGDKFSVAGRAYISVEPREVELSWRIKKGDRVLEGNRKQLEKGKLENKQFYMLKTSIDVINGDSVGYRLFYKRNEIESGVIKKEEITNPRMIGHDLFDKDLNLLKKFLNGEGRDRERDFECGVHMLLHMVGFAAEFLGYMGGILNQGEIDVLAFTPNYKNLLAAECTVTEGNISDKKLKLFRKVKELEEKLRITIVPAMFICLEKDKIPENLRDAIKSSEIALVSCEEIKNIYQMLRDNNSVDEIFNYIDELRKNLIHFRGGHLGFS